MKKFIFNDEYILPIEVYLEKLSHYTFINSTEVMIDENDDESYQLQQSVNQIIESEAEKQFDIASNLDPNLDKIDFYTDFNFPNVLLVFKFHYLKTVKGFKFSHDLLLNLIDTFDVDDGTKNDIFAHGVSYDVLFFEFHNQLRNISAYPINNQNGTSLFINLSKAERRTLQSWY